MATNGIGDPVNVGLSGGEPFAPGTRMEYTDEYVAGFQHEFRNGIVFGVRYIDRRLKRVIEDQGGISVEEFIALANNGGGLNYFIGNPNAKQDIFVNPNEITFGLGTNFTSSQETQSSLPAACVDSNGFATPYVAWDVLSPLTANVATGQPPVVAGSACFPSVNQSTTWSIPNPAYDPVKNPNVPKFLLDPNAEFGGEFHPDGKPDTYKDPRRVYQAIEIEANKSFGHNWALNANWRIARLNGNYEGAFRNDNNQADPGISSLFDLTEGSLGLLGAQQGIGPLNTDRRHVVNVNAFYVLDRSRLKGLVIGSGLRIQTGLPLTTLYAQYAYQNAGEVPWFGRGDLGRAPTTSTVDAQIEYPWKLTERLSLKLGFSAFNIANRKSQTLINQNADQGFGVTNANDFKGPYATTGMNNYFFQQPFSSRLSLRLVF